MAIILTIGYLLLFTGIIFKWRFFESTLLKKKYIIAIFLLKVLCGVGMYYVYSQHYTDRSTADIFKYFDDSQVMYDALDENPGDYFQMLFGVDNDQPYFDKYYGQMNNWYRRHGGYMYNDSHTIIRFNALVRIFSGGHFHVHTVFMCFLSLIGLMGLFKTFAPRMPGKEKLLAIIIFLTPSVLFWGSGVLKEGFLMFGMGTFIYGVFNLIDRKKILQNSIIAAGAAFLMVFVKVYVLLALIPAIAGYILARNKKKILLKYAAVWLVGILCVLSQHHLTGKTDFPSILVQKQQDFVNIAHGGVYMADQERVYYIPDSLRSGLEYVDKDSAYLKEGAIHYTWEHGTTDTTRSIRETSTETMVKLYDNEASGSMIHIPELEPNAFSLIKTAPMAIANTLFRPFIWEAEGAFMWFAALENLLFIGLIVFAIIYFKRPDPSSLNLILFCSTVALIILLLTGWVTPVLGAIVRYKVPALPFIGMILILLMKKRKWFALLSMVTLLNACSYRGEEVDLIIHNANIYQAKNHMIPVEAMAIDNGKIVEIGAEREIMNQYSGEEELDLRGKPVYPLFLKGTHDPIGVYHGLVSGESEGLKIDRGDAFLRLTQWAARDMMMDREVGTLEAGKYADFMILNGDIIKLPIDDLKNVQIEKVYREGKLE